MSQMLKAGQKLQQGGLVVEALLGAGGQGEVYRVKDTRTNQQYALKWYFPKNGTDEQERSIADLVKKYHPGPEFLWPKALVKEPGVSGFGYTMALRDKAYNSLVDLMKRKADPSFEALIKASYRLVQGFRWLHQSGLCYRDISLGNAFFRAHDGQILICDNDNVSPPDDASKDGVVGTPKFMAPEIVRGESGPNTNTDLFSLSVLLFHFFFISHPLDGAQEAAIKCFDLPAMRRLYGDNPIYIFHPTDGSNKPVPGIHDNAIAYYKVYPKFFLDLFQKAFVDGLAAERRVTLSQWRDGLVKLLAHLHECRKCGAENFGTHHACWSCGTKPNAMLVLETSAKVEILLSRKTKGYAEMFGKYSDNSFQEIYFEANPHPNDPSVIGIKNVTKQTWLLDAPGKVQQVAPGQNIRLAPGGRLKLGIENYWLECKL